MEKIFALSTVLFFLLVGCNSEIGEESTEILPYETIDITEICTDYPTDTLLNVLHIETVDDETGWALSYEAIWRIDLVNNTWNNVTPQVLFLNNPRVAGSFLDSKHAWVAIVQDEEPKITVIHTQDGGYSWKPTIIEREYPGRVYSADINFIDAKTGWLLLEAEHGMSSDLGELYKTEDGGEVWFQISSTREYKDNKLPFSGKISFSNNSNGWLVGRKVATGYNILYFTSDSGVTWQQQDILLPSELPQGKIDIAAPPVFFPPQNTDGILIANYRPEDTTQNSVTIVYYTQDSGSTWQYAPPIDSYGLVYFITVDIGWMWRPDPSGAGKLMKTTDGGCTWNTIVEIINRTQEVMQIYFYDQQNGFLLLRESDFKTAVQKSPIRVLTTGNGGCTWFQLTPLIEIIEPIVLAME